MTFLYNRAPLLLLLTALFWAGNMVLGRAVVGEIPSITLVTLRWWVAAALLLPFAWPHLRRDYPTIRRHLPFMIFLGILGPGCYNLLSYLGLIFTEATNGLILNAAGPAFIAASSFVIFGDRLSRYEFQGLLLGILGVLFVVSKGNLAALATFSFNRGDLLIIAAMATWAIYTAILRKRPVMSWQSYNAFTFAVAALFNLPFALWEHALGHELRLTLPTVLAVSYVAIFPTLIAYVFYNRSVDLVGATRSGLYLFLVPVFGSAMAIALLGERLALHHAAGFALIIAGVIVGNKRAPAKNPAAQPAE